MVLANRAKLQNSRSLVRVFGGLNETYACSEAEYSAGVNFSARDFPALSTRKPRRKLRELTGLNGMYHLNGLLTVCGKDLIYTPDADGANPVTCTEAVTDGKKALVGIGTKILIFPDKVAFDTADGSVSALGAVWQAKGQSVQFAPCDAAGKAYEVSGYGKEEPEKPADGQLFLKVEDEEHPWASTSTLEEYSASSGSWTAVPLEYCRITAAGAQRLFAQWDTVTVQGTAAQQAGMWTKLDGDLVVYDVLENGLRVRVNPEGDHVYGTLVQSAESAQWTSQLRRQGDTQLCGEHAGADGTPRAGSGLRYRVRQPGMGLQQQGKRDLCLPLRRPHQLVFLPGHCGRQLRSDGGQRWCVYRRGHMHGLCAVL